jgi:hypothetical protein
LEITMQRFLSFGYLAAIAGGLLLAVGALVAQAGAQGQAFSAQVVTTSFVISAALRLIGATGILIGVTAIYARESDLAGVFGLVAYVLVVIGMVLHLGTICTDLFVTGALAVNAPGILDGSVSDTRLTIMFMASWLFTTTLVLLGIASLRARMYGRAVGWLLVAAGAVSLIPLDGLVTEAMYAILFAVTGFLASRVVTRVGRREETESAAVVAGH